MVFFKLPEWLPGTTQFPRPHEGFWFVDRGRHCAAPSRCLLFARFVEGGHACVYLNERECGDEGDIPRIMIR